MSVQLESNGILDGGPFDPVKPSSLFNDDKSDAPLADIDSNLPSLSKTTRTPFSATSPSASAAQKALNQLATRPPAFARAQSAVIMHSHHDDHLSLHSFHDVDQLLRDEEENAQSRSNRAPPASTDDDDEQEMLAMIEAEEEQRQAQRAEASQSQAARPPAIELEDLLGMTQPQDSSTSSSTPGSLRTAAAAAASTTSTIAASTVPAPTAATTTASETHKPAALSALERVQAEMDLESGAAAQLDLPSCAQAGPSGSNAIGSSSSIDVEDHSSSSRTATSSTTARNPSCNVTTTGIPKYIPAGFAYATSFDGKELRFERQKRLKAWKPSAIYADTRVENLISRPIYQLRNLIEATKALEVVERQEAADAAAFAALVATEGAGKNESPTKSGSGRKDRKSGQMWVDRYRPKRFTELLGDERVHRDLLGWLKEWDECVFKRKNLRKQRHRQYLKNKWAASNSFNGGGASSEAGPAAGAGAGRSTSAPNAAGAMGAGLPGGGGFGADGGRPPWKDPYGRPSERVLMVSGPPGLGKTTLAHVIAQHAGYNVFELNASDARTAGAVEDLIRMALESGSLKDPRPTLVVIDEIDGAQGGGAGSSANAGEGAGFVRALVRLIENGKGPATRGDGDGSSFRRKAHGGKGKKKGHKPLLRPIICVCNDLYAPALRPLRPLAKLIRFNKAPTSIVVKRLREICEIEGVEADTRGLSLLCELTGGDVRACINALEFAKTKNLYLTEAAVRNAAVGIKDTGTTVHGVWEMLFRTQNPKEKIKSSTKGHQSGHIEAGGGSDKAAPWNNQNVTRRSASMGVGLGQARKGDAVMVDRLLHEISSCNEYDKLAQGCFEHYPHLRASDDGWNRYRVAHEWLDFGQAISSKAWSNSSFELLAYMPWSFVPWHLLFASVGNALPEYPRTDYEMYLKTTAYLEIATTLHDGLPPGLRTQFNRQTIHLELGPTLARIVAPELKPINNAITSTAERATLARLVDVMLGLNLSLVQDSSESDTTSLVWKMNPPLEVFNLFEGKANDSSMTGRGKTRLAVRAIVAREMEKEKTRRALATASKTDGDVGTEGPETTADKAMSVYRNGGQKAHLANDVAKGKVAKDFFGRIIVPKSVPVAAKMVEIPEGMHKRPSTGEAADQSGNKKARHDDAKTKREGGLKVFYRYHEGFSNAVRRPVKMSALL